MTKKNTAIFSVFTLISAALNFFFAGSFFEFLGIEFLIAACVCVVAAACPFGMGVASVVVGSACAFAGGGVPGSILAFITSVFAFLAGISLKNKISTGKLVVILASGVFLSAVMFIVYQTNVMGVKLVDDFLSATKSDFIYVAQQYMKTMGVEGYEAVITQYADTYFMYVRNTIPAILIIISLVLAFFSACVVSLFLKVVKMRELYRVKFSEFMCDRTTTVVFAVSAVCIFFMKEGVLQAVFVNVFMILLFVFQICGFSLLDSILKKKNLPSGFRFLIMVFAWLFMTAGIPLAILIGGAVFDSFKNFRAIGVEADETDESDDNGDKGSE